MHFHCPKVSFSFNTKLQVTNSWLFNNHTWSGRDIYVIPWGRIHRTLIITQLAVNFPTFLDPKSSLPSSQEPTSIRQCIQFTPSHCSYNTPNCTQSLELFLLFTFLDKIVYEFLTSTICTACPTQFMFKLIISLMSIKRIHN
jgi:hypothetical protein